MVAPIRPVLPADGTQMTTLRRLWTGQLPLEEAFWSWAVVGGLLVNVATSFSFLALVAADRPIAALIAGYVPSVPYNVVVLVGVWRAASRYGGGRARAELMRAVTLVGMVVLTVT
jgi:hypothetical protein